MKAITIYQPWASLIAVGAKKYETMSWATKHRGKIAIHAGKKPYNLGDIDFAIARGLMDAAEHIFGIYEANNLTLGAVIATAELMECHYIFPRPGVYGDFTGTGILRVFDAIVEPPEEEILFGDWTPGRYAWELANVQMLPEPVPARGQQRLFDIEL